MILATFALAVSLRALDCQPIGDQRYRITFESVKPVRIRLSTGESLAEAATSPAEVRVPIDVLHPIFRLQVGRETRSISIRHLSLTGSPNFRDLGGYETQEGRHVVWGTLFRSGSLARLTESDYRQLNSLGLDHLFDFRTADERTAEPTRWVGTAPTTENLAIGEEDGAMGLSAFAKLLQQRVGPAEMQRELEKFYGQVPIAAAPHYAKVFRHLLTNSGATMWHCSAGKDRTGVFSAFLLTVLGVPHETVIADYELTNQFYFDERRLPLMAAGIRGMMHLDFDVDPAVLRPALRAEPAYIESAFRAIETKYGSFDRYRREALGLSDGDVRGLKRRYLEP